MPREMFDTTGDGVTRARGRQWYTVPLSMVTHSALIALMVGIPLLMSDALPTPASVLVFAAPPRAPAQPVVQPEVARPSISNAPTQTFAAYPTSAPDGFVTEPPPVLSASPGALDSMFGGLRAGPALGGPPPVVPVPPPSAPLRVGGDITAPRKVQDAAPVYPAVAKSARVQGTVFIEAIIGKDGSVRNVRVLGRSQMLLDEAALAAVRQWRYTPSLLNGEPVEVVMTVTVQFMLAAK